ncbi:hypothetical protein O181_042688 [Austropuccinia psidii MF-1]|uniref:Uncharacterized protein n=1 Tax=Austropuccinia psidii MF-1 TaxID=1389203 RepID=A0A9Q3HF03_9BASI|nr:hypothetical protein [Austropuccinia psidii MF-1]
MLLCLNHSLNERLNKENVYVAGIIPCPKEPNLLQLNYLLMPLIKEFKEKWQDYHFAPTSTGPSGSFIQVSILTAIADVVAMRKITGFVSHSGRHFVIFALFTRLKLKKLVLHLTTRTYPNHKSTIAKWPWASPQQIQAIFSEDGVKYSVLEDLMYCDATRMVNLDIMHNLILVILNNHAAFKLCIPKSKSKIHFQTRMNSNDTNS